MAQEFVEYQHLATRFEHTGNFSEAMGRLRYNGQNQVEYGRVETFVSQRQALGIALYRQKIKLFHPG